MFPICQAWYRVVGMTKEAFLTNTHSLNYTCTQTHKLTDLPLIVQVKLCIFICGLGKKKKKTSDIFNRSARTMQMYKA